MDFVEHVKNTCKTFNVQCKLKNTKYLKLDATNRCSGYFDESVPVLACAMNRPDSFEILVHEFAHFTQWAEQCTAWTNAMNAGAYDRFNAMLEGKKVRNLSHYLGLCRDLELDNEKRTINIIKKFISILINSDRNRCKKFFLIHSFNKRDNINIKSMHNVKITILS
jgi:hypothetical protein